ncbi:MAG: hypothetical protein U0519_01150 [Candidatus Gracilibacteria bacterium]
MNEKFRKILPIFLAIDVAIIAVVFYMLSGRSSLDNNVRLLEKNSTVERVETSGENTILVKCKNGESYEIIYQPGQNNFDNLVYDKCGHDGAISVPANEPAPTQE